MCTSCALIVNYPDNLVLFARKMQVWCFISKVNISRLHQIIFPVECMAARLDCVLESALRLRIDKKTRCLLLLLFHGKHLFSGAPTMRASE